MFSDDSRIKAATVESAQTHSTHNIASHYRLDSVEKFIKERAARRVALQFPDSLLPDTVPLVAELESRLAGGDEKTQTTATDNNDRVRLFVLSDNTFGACCPDEITAAHYDADCLIHFGYACMSKNTRLPVMYVHERLYYSVDRIVDTVRSITSNRKTQDDENDDINNNGAVRHQIVIVLCNSGKHLKDTIETALRQRQKEDDADGNENKAADSAQIIVTERPKDEAPHWTVAGDAIPRMSAAAPATTEGDDAARDKLSSSSTIRCQSFIFVGPHDSPVLNQLAFIIRYNDSIGLETGQLIMVPPTDDDSSSSNSSSSSSSRTVYEAPRTALRRVDQRLAKRMYHIEHLKSSESIGILVCTLSISKYRESTDALRTIVRHFGKRCYVIYIGHLNEFKIANFADSIDAFVVISCPHSRAAQFPEKGDNLLKPLCTPVELLIASGYTSFSDPEAYTTDFGAVCTAAAAQISSALIEGGGGSLNHDSEHSSLVRAGHGAVQRFTQRAYRGLETKLGETAVQTEVATGRSGIAKGYTSEKTNLSKQ